MENTLKILGFTALFDYKGAENWVKNCYVKVYKCSLRNSLLVNRNFLFEG